MESGTCNNCNVEIYPTAIFCHKCGHRLKCEDCGAFLVKDANNCISCGKKINQENNPNTALKNTVTYRKTKDETFFDASLSDTVAKDGIGSLIANITNNRLPEGKFTNKEIEDLTDHIKKNDSDTLDIDSEEVVNEVNSKDGSNEFQHISDVEMNVNCSEAEWILIYAFYESEYATKRFTKKAVYDKYMSVRKTQSHINHFPENWKGLFKLYFATVNDVEIKFKPDNLAFVRNLILGKEKGTIRNVVRKKAVSKGVKPDSDAAVENPKISKSKNKLSQSGSYSFVTTLNLHPPKIQSLKDFYSQYNTTITPEVILVIVYYLEKILKEKNIGENAIYTCYKNIGLAVPNIHQGLSNIHTRKGWIDTSNRSDLKITTTGENHIEHTMKKVIGKKI